MRNCYLTLLFLLSLFCSQKAHAVATPIKNLHVYAQALPAGAGTVYLAPKEKDKDYVKEQSQGFGSTAMLKFTSRENGGVEDSKAHCGDCQDGVAMYEALVSAKANEDYEFVCFAVDKSWDDVYYKNTTYAVHTGDDTSSYRFSWDYSGIENGVAINVNSARRPQDGDDNSGQDVAGDNGKGQPYVFAHGTWSDNPDTYVYAIFRKKGETRPELNLNGATAPDDPFITAPAAKQDRISLNSYDGLSWQIFPQTADNMVTAREADYQPGDYVDGIVPGTVFASYVAAGREEDPNFADNIYKVDEKKYNKAFWYRTSFDSPQISKGQRILLTLEGTNRSSVVYLNGKRLGSIEGHVLKNRYDVTNVLKPEGNVLAILILPFKDKVLDRNSNFVNYICPTYVPSHSWDWMPYVPGLNTGVTNDVYLEIAGGVSVRDPWVRTASLSADRKKAVVQAQTSLVNLTSTKKQIELKATITPGNYELAKSVTIDAGDSINVKFDDLEIENPRLWWPNGYGEQNLYECSVEVVAEGVVIDNEKTTFGIRRYDYKKENTAMVVYCNGEKIFCKGGNWGMSEYMLRCNGDEYDTRVRLHQDMNYNMIRLWTGCVTDEEFYDACDKYGIMVWDDFWLTGPYVGLTGPDDVPCFMSNVKDKIIRLRNHPSIAVWCGDNEGWPYDELNNAIDNAIKVYDAADRRYIPNSHNGYFTAKANDNKDGSGLGLSGSGWWQSFPPENYFKDGIQGGGGDYGDITDWGFRSELGTGGFCTYESFKEFMPADKMWPRNNMWDKHFFSDAAEYGGAASATRYFNQVKTSYGEASNIQQFCEKSQLYNIEVMKAAYEGWNYNLWNTATGLLLWMSQPAYPSLLWQTYDYYLDMTGNYWGAKKACEPVHIQWNCNNHDVSVVNTSLKEISGYKAEIELFDLNGNKNESVSGNVSNISAAPNHVVNVYNINTSGSKTLANAARGMFFIRLSLYDENDKLVSQNFYWKTTSGTSKDVYTSLNNIAKADVTADFATSTYEGGVVKATVSLNNNSATPAFALRLRLVDDEGKRILPVIMDDNYIILMPGESREVNLEYNEANVSGKATLLIKQYNYPESAASVLDAIDDVTISDSFFEAQTTRVYSISGELLRVVSGDVNEALNALAPGTYIIEESNGYDSHSRKIVAK